MSEQQLSPEQVKILQESFVEQLKQIFVEFPSLRPVTIIGYNDTTSIVVMPFADMPFKLVKDTIISLADDMKKENKNIN